MGECTDLCAAEEFDCDQYTCGLMLLLMEAQGMSNWGTCYTSSYDVISTCEDDGGSPCDGDQDLCQTTCLSTNGECENCFDLPVDMAEYGLGSFNCDEYEPLFPTFFPGVEFPGYCSCFTFNETYDLKIGCQSACGSDSSDNTGIEDGSSDNTGIEDDGGSPCDGDQDLCQTTCLSTNGKCENCFDLPVDMAEYDLGGLDCDEYAGLFPTFFPGFEFPGYCSCFTFNETNDLKIGCHSACGSGSSDNTGMIIGIVVGVVVLIIVVIAVIICMKRRKL